MILEVQVVGREGVNNNQQKRDKADHRKQNADDVGNRGNADIVPAPLHPGLVIRAHALVAHGVTSLR